METQLNPITTLMIMYTLLVSSPGFLKNQFFDIKKLKKNSNKLSKLIEFSLVKKKYHNFPPFFC
jgi:hypothetical protein